MTCMLATDREWSRSGIIAGGNPGFGAEMRYVPALDLGTVTFGNSTGAGFAGNTLLCYEIIDNILGIERTSQLDWKKEWLCKEEQGGEELRGIRDPLFAALDKSHGR